MTLLSLLYSQFFVRLPYPQGSYEEQTVIVTGSNTGLGKEAARHFTRLGAKKVILAVRSLEKGEDAKHDIERTTGRTDGVVQVWQLDMGSYESVQQFASRCEKELDRIDIFIANAGCAKHSFETMEDNETTITVNVVSTFLLAFLMLPKLRATATKYNTRPNLTITSSEVHEMTSFEPKSAAEGDIFNTMNDKERANMDFRYPDSKLLEVFGVRAMADRRSSSQIPVTINCLNPGLCHSELSREAGIGLEIMKFFLARSTEVGSRTLVHAGSQGAETHGQYLSDCQITLPSHFVLSPEGRKVQDRVWDELVAKLENIKPGVTSNL